MDAIKAKFMSFLNDEEAPTFFEYGLLVVVIALAVVASASTFGISVAKFFESVPGSP